jgi:cellulase
MARIYLPVGLALAGLATAQTPVGTEAHPKLVTYRCTVEGGCSESTNYLVLDSLAHNVHQINSTESCGSWGSAPNATVCPTEEACAQNCIQEALTDYASQGVTTDGASLRMQMIVNNASVSPRIYLLDETEEKYEMVQFTGAEFSFDVDSTKLPCGMNSALYLSEMEAEGGKSDLNQGGAARGTGYCDAQCYTTPFINGVVCLPYSAFLYPYSIYEDVVCRLDTKMTLTFFSLSRETLQETARAAMKWTYGRPTLGQRR